MSELNVNPVDTSRDQYFDYGDYISRRHGDRYYNLGYAIYKAWSYNLVILVILRLLQL